MDQGVHTFRFATLNQRGAVVLSQEGLDLVRCLLIRWVEQAANGEQTALDMGGRREGHPQHRQALYFRHARSYLLQKLTSGLSEKVNLKSELQILAQWHDGHDLPSKWRECIELATQMEGVNGDQGATQFFGGIDSTGGDIPTQVADGAVGQGPAAGTDPGKAVGDTGSGGVADGASTLSDGASGAKPNRGRGRQRKSSS